MRFALVFLSLIILSSCGSMETIDRSLVNSPLMQMQESSQDAIAPHTGFRGSGATTGGACTVCAH